MANIEQLCAMCKGNIDLEEHRNTGKIVVKGLCYEDLVSILTMNGYDVYVKATFTKNATTNTYTILYEPHDFIGDIDIAEPLKE